MIAGGDESVRNAFRATLRDEPSRPCAFVTQELDAIDILEVHDLANAIERAEQITRAAGSSRPRDIFDMLLKSDDCSGPAVPASHPTPIPARPPLMVAPRARTLLAPVATPIPVTVRSRSFGPPPPSAAPPLTPSPLATLRVPVPPASSRRAFEEDDDAFHQPSGRMRGLADVTLDGYRPEPTLLVRIRDRRRTLTWIVATTLAVLALLAAATTLMSARSEEPVRNVITHATIVKTVRPPEAATTALRSDRPATAAVRVLDVNSLPSAPRPRSR